jgi:hypothetical protein
MAGSDRSPKQRSALTGLCPLPGPGGWADCCPPCRPTAELEAFLARCAAAAATGVGVVLVIPGSTGARCWKPWVKDTGAIADVRTGRIAL